MGKVRTCKTRKTIKKKVCNRYGCFGVKTVKVCAKY